MFFNLFKNKKIKEYENNIALNYLLQECFLYAEEICSKSYNEYAPVIYTYIYACEFIMHSSFTFYTMVKETDNSIDEKLFTALKENFIKYSKQHVGIEVKYPLSRFELNSIWNYRTRTYINQISQPAYFDDIRNVEDKSSTISALRNAHVFCEADILTFVREQMPFAHYVDYLNHLTNMEKNNIFEDKTTKNIADKLYSIAQISKEKFFKKNINNSNESNESQIQEDNIEQELNAIIKECENSNNIKRNDKDKTNKIEVIDEKDPEDVDKDKFKIIPAVKFLIITFIAIQIIANISSSLEKQKVIKIDSLNEKGYLCYKNKDENCVDNISKEIAKLTKSSVLDIKEDFKYRFKKEQLNILSQLRSASNEEFQKIKNENLKTYFDNDEEKLYVALDKLVGHKYYSKKEISRPKTGILKNELPQSDLYENMYLLIRYDDLYVKFINVKTNKSISIYIRKNQKYIFSLPRGSYRLTYMTGSKWCGEKDLFKDISSKGAGSQDIIINDEACIFLGETQSMFIAPQPSFQKLTVTEWDEAVLAIEKAEKEEEVEKAKKEQEEVNRILNPNYDLKMEIN